MLIRSLAKAFHRHLLAIIGLAALAFASPASADMDQSMTAQFNAMVNVTPPGVYEAQGARIIGGGSFVYRPRVSRVQLFTMDPPRIKSGCNGIDAYTGAFSWISKDALINMVRNIAAAAPAYAFNLALSFLCKDCDQHLRALQNLANNVNALNINTCKLDFGENQRQIDNIITSAQAVGTSMKQMGGHLVGMASDWDAAKDHSNDVWNKLWDASKAGNQEAKSFVGEVNVNIAWDSGRKSKLSEWWGGVLGAASNRQFYETMMSFTGTLLTLPVPSKDDPAKNKDRTRYLPPTITFRDFLEGGRVEIYKCPPPLAVDDDECLMDPDESNRPMTKQEIILPSYKKKVRDILIGDGVNQGIVPKLTARRSSGGLALTPQQQAFITALPGGVYAQLRELAAFPFTSQAYAEAISDWIAVEMTYEYLDTFVRHARTTSLSSNAAALVNEFQSRLDVINEQVKTAREVALSQMEGVNQHIQMAEHFRMSIARANAHGIRPNQFGPQN